MKYMQSCR